MASSGVVDSSAGFITAFSGLVLASRRRSRH